MILRPVPFHILNILLYTRKQPLSLMPSKRASSSKRKAEPSDSEADSEAPAPKPAKKAKSKASTPPSPPANAQPTNKVLPTHIEFTPRAPGTVRIATWNICGLAAAQKKVRDADVAVARADASRPR